MTMSAATGGVAVALDALMRERGGVWMAHGAGAADRLVVDESDKLRVPLDAPSYTLRRLWLEEPTFSAYYGGFANEGLWPLCHVVDVRPKFRSGDWAAYQDINARFAAATHAEIGVVRGAGVHPGLPSRARRARAAGPTPQCPHRALLAHSLASSRSTPHLPMATRAGRRTAGQRPDRVSARARSPKLSAWPPKRS